MRGLFFLQTFLRRTESESRNREKTLARKTNYSYEKRQKELAKKKKKEEKRQRKLEKKKNQVVGEKTTDTPDIDRL